MDPRAPGPASGHVIQLEVGEPVLDPAAPGHVGAAGHRLGHGVQGEGEAGREHQLGGQPHLGHRGHGDQGHAH